MLPQDILSLGIPFIVVKVVISYIFFCYVLCVERGRRKRSCSNNNPSIVKAAENDSYYNKKR
jgi:hypothetical protein